MKETFLITINFIDKKNLNEGYAIFCHSSIDGIGLEYYTKKKEETIQLIKSKKKIEKVIDYTKGIK